MVNKAILMGYLGRDPELNYTPDGTPVAGFTMGTHRRWTDADGNLHTETEWHRIECWGTLAESAVRYLTKGRLIYVEGRLRTDRWEADGVQQRRTWIIAQDIRYIPNGKPVPRPAFEVEDLPADLPTVAVEATPAPVENPRRNGRKKHATAEV